MVVIIVHIDAVGGVFRQIFTQALTPDAAAGGAVGISVRTAVSWGFRRGAFSNEAGLGSAPIAHASSSEKNPVVQGMYGIFEVFLDTIIICTITGLTLLVSGIGLDYGSFGTIELNIAAFATVFGGQDRRADPVRRDDHVRIGDRFWLVPLRDALCGVFVWKPEYTCV